MTVDKANKRSEELFIECFICGKSIKKDSPRRKYCGNKHLKGDCSWKAWKLSCIREKMISRCNNAKDREYEYYGKRRIKVCSDWNNLDNFIRDVAINYEPGLSIDRINNNGDYVLKNVRWSTTKEQSRNRNITKKYLLNGRLFALGDLCDEFRISYSVVWQRLKRGWSMEQALGVEKKERIIIKIEERNSISDKYYTGSMCHRGHDYKQSGLSLRYKSCRQCVYCVRGEYAAR